MRILLMLLFPVLASAQAKVDFAGGTATIPAKTGGVLDVSGSQQLVFAAKKGRIEIPYAKVNLLEYGQQVDRRLLLAVTISPAFLLAKSRKHFLTVGYSDEQGQQQALVFRVDKNSIRGTLVSLEARTGLKIQYQDLDARKAGKG